MENSNGGIKLKKLIHVDGNLLTDSRVQVISHQCNCQCVMGAGIAASIKKMYPEAYQADIDADAKDMNVLGNISYVIREENPRAIFNLYGQNLTSKTTRMTNYEALYSALVLMRSKVDALFGDEPPTIGFPHGMGCGLGGGQWEIVERLIEVSFDGYENDVYIVKFNP